MLKFIDITVPEGAIHPTVQFLQQLWPVFDKIFQQHGHRIESAETLSKFFRNVLDSTKSDFHPLFAPLLNSLITSFQNTNLSCYIWVCAKVVKYFSTLPQARSDIIQMVNTITQRAFQIIQTTGVNTPEPELGIQFLT